MPATGDIPTPEQALASLENTLLAGDVSKQTNDTIAAQLNDPKISQRRLDDPARPPDVSVIEGLLLGSPEFQKR
jgi:signal recognition particle GTPase